MERVSVDLRIPGVALISLSGEHDSTIVGVLLEAKQIAAERGADYCVVLGATTGEPVRRMFEITGLVGILPVVERDALAQS
jgi:hypothetical protein